MDKISGNVYDCFVYSTDAEGLFIFFIRKDISVLGELPEMHDVFKYLFKPVTKRMFSNLFLKHVTLGRFLSVKFTPCHEAVSSKV